jgi:hypothetical protein
MTTPANRDRPTEHRSVDDDAWGTAPGADDADFIVDETAPQTVEGKLFVMAADLRRLLRTSLATTAAVAALIGLFDLWYGHGFGTTVGFLVGGGLATLNLWVLAGGYFAVVEGRAVVPRMLLALTSSMILMFGVALFVVVAKREWTLGFALGAAVPALSGLVYGLQKRPASR